VILFTYPSQGRGDYILFLTKEEGNFERKETLIPPPIVIIRRKERKKKRGVYPLVI